MPEPINPRGQDNPSQYFVEDRSNDAEMIRQMIQDRTITEGMGGPLAEQPDPASLHRVLDVGCGPGGWLLETARLYPHMELVGIDISWRMIEYARAEAQARRLTDGVEFLVMDALRPLDFPDASFDLVNMRFGTSFLLVKDWPRLLHELLRVTRPGGIIRITEYGSSQNNSPALTRLNEMFLCALHRAGHIPTSDAAAMTPFLTQILSESGCQNVQIRAYVLEYLAGTVGGENFYQNMMYAFQTTLPFMQKMGCATEDYDAIYQQALIEMQQKKFRAQWNLLTTWGSKPHNEQEGVHEDTTKGDPDHADTD